MIFGKKIPTVYNEVPPMNLTSTQLKFNARQLMDHRYPTGIAPVC